MTINAKLQEGKPFYTLPLTQYDEGQMIHLSGAELPESYLAEFSNSESGTAEQITQTSDIITVPDKYLTSGSPIYIWVVVTDEDERTTRYEIIVPVKQRGKPDDYTPTPSEQTAIEAAITALNSAVTAAGVAIEHYPRITDGVWQVWDVSAGEWISTEVPAQGPQGETGATGNGIASAVLNADYTLTLTFTNGQTYTTPSIRGAQGGPGPAGQDGADGYSPTATVSKSNGVATITITDKDGTTTAQVSDGATGQTGPAGADGYSPTASVSKSGSTATITITDKQGTTTAQVTDGQDGSPGASAYVWIRYAAAAPTQDSDMKTTPDAWMGIYSGDSATAPTAYTAYTWYNIKGQTGPVSDVQVDGVSVLNQGVANVPIASDNVFGVMKIMASNGIALDTNKRAYIFNATSQIIKAGTNEIRPIAPNHQHESTFYGLAKAAGADMASISGATVGVYPEAQKSAISQMLNAPETVSGSTPSITAKAGVRYVCGECATLDITLPASGCVDVVFESGSTPTVLTITPPTGVTVKWANGFDPTSLEANTTYEINIMNGLGVAGSWT